MYSLEDVRRLIDDGSIKVYDFGDTVADRYTVWLDPKMFPFYDWAITGFAMSDRPNSPQGFNQCLVDNLYDYVENQARDTLLATREVSAYVIEAIRRRLSD